MFNAHTYSSTIGSMSGVAKIPVSAAVPGGDWGRRRGLDVAIERDDGPREVALPTDLAAALAQRPTPTASTTPQPKPPARLHQLGGVREEAGDRQRRVSETVTLLAQRRPQR